MRWSYKTVHYELKKDGLLGSTFLDESEIEISLNEYGKAGWELVSLLETLDGLTAVFKQPLSLETESFTPAPATAVPPRSDMKEQEKAHAETVAFDDELQEEVDIDLGKVEEEEPALATGDPGEEDLEEVVLWEENSQNQQNKKLKKKTIVEEVDVGSIRIE